MIADRGADMASKKMTTLARRHFRWRVRRNLALVLQELKELRRRAGKAQRRSGEAERRFKRQFMSDLRRVGGEVLESFADGSALVRTRDELLDVKCQPSGLLREVRDFDAFRLRRSVVGPEPKLATLVSAAPACVLSR